MVTTSTTYGEIVIWKTQDFHYNKPVFSTDCLMVRMCVKKIGDHPIFVDVSV